VLAPFEFLPKSIAPAVLAYLVICYGLGDVFAGRLAERVHIPACVRGKLSAAAKSDYGRNLEKQIARDLLGALLRSTPALHELPGMDVVVGASRRQDVKDYTRAAVLRCNCLAVAARSETKFDHMFWVASLRVHEPAGVSQFGGVMTRLDQIKTCGIRRES